MMEVCRRALPDHHSSSGQAVLVPATNANVTLAFNNQANFSFIYIIIIIYPKLKKVPNNKIFNVIQRKPKRCLEI